MKTIFSILAIVFFVGCAKQVLYNDPVLYNYMPDSINIMDTLLTTVKPSDKLPQYDDFKSITINGGSAYSCTNDKCTVKDSVKLPAGIVVSDRTYFELLDKRAGIEDVNKRLIVAKELFTSYNKQVKVAEVLYDKQLQLLQKKTERSWIEKNAAYIGFAAGILTAIAVQSITVQITK